jgi:hypothetical protein
MERYDYGEPWSILKEQFMDGKKKLTRHGLERLGVNNVGVKMTRERWTQRVVKAADMGELGVVLTWYEEVVK